MSIQIRDMTNSSLPCPEAGRGTDGTWTGCIRLGRAGLDTVESR